MMASIDQAIERATAQLGAIQGGQPDLDARVAGIRALEQIAQRSDRHRTAIVTVLSTYACQHARGGRPEDPRRQVIRSRLDVYEIFSAFDRLRRAHGAAIVPDLA